MNRSDELNQRIELQNDPKRQIRGVLRRSWGLLGPLGPLLGGSRAALGRFWALLGGSWGGLGPLLGALGPSWDGLGAILRASDHKIENQVENCQTPFAFWVDFGSQNGSQNDPKTIQNESKIKTKNASLFYRSWTRLGPVLRRSWDHLGVKKVCFPLRFPMFRENRCFRTNDASRRIFGTT